MSVKLYADIVIENNTFFIYNRKASALETLKRIEQVIGESLPYSKNVDDAFSNLTQAQLLYSTQGSGYSNSGWIFL